MAGFNVQMCASVSSNVLLYGTVDGTERHKCWTTTSPDGLRAP